jgi:hypothetical protein
MAYIPLNLKDLITTLDEEQFKHIEDGIAGAHISSIEKTTKDSIVTYIITFQDGGKASFDVDLTNESVSTRLDALERWKQQQNYKKISINVTSKIKDKPYGIWQGVGEQFVWSLTKKAKRIEVTSPSGFLFAKYVDDNNSIKVELPDGTIITESDDRYSHYATVYLEADKTSYFVDTTSYRFEGARSWTIKAIEADGTTNDAGEPVYGDATGTITVGVYYYLYAGSSAEVSGNTEDFIKGFPVKEKITSGGKKEISFDGINDEFIYIALPASLYSTATFDIWQDGFKENFLKMTAEDGYDFIRVLFTGAAIPANYYLFRSPNKITDPNPFKIDVS